METITTDYGAFSNLRVCQDEMDDIARAAQEAKRDGTGAISPSQGEMEETEVTDDV